MVGVAVIRGPYAGSQRSVTISLEVISNVKAFY
jgi:hypothetical protein